MDLIAEYIWIDPQGQYRSKAKTIVRDNFDRLTLDSFPIWNFDGTSTGHVMSGNDSEVHLKPVKYYSDPFRMVGRHNCFLVLCVCTNKEGAPALGNTRNAANMLFEKTKEYKPWFGLEQEYVLYDNNTGRPLGWPADPAINPEPQGKYYCSVGSDRAFGRKIVNEHYRVCLEVGLKISGINAEVMPGQWEFQVGPCEGIDSGDQVHMARYLMYRVCEEYGVIPCFKPKPEKGDWNGSGCHVNFSTSAMRAEDGIEYIYAAIRRLEGAHAEHLAVYGTNHDRLTGAHETSSMDRFTYGVGDRSASVRIPNQAIKDGRGYLEDRRPASDCDPYVVTAQIMETVAQ